MTVIERRDKMWRLLTKLIERLKNNPEHDDLDAEVTLLLKSIAAAEFRDPPNHSFLVEYPVWETVCVAAEYGSIVGWGIPRSHRIQGYLPNDDAIWLVKFRSKWDDLRQMETTTGAELLHLLMSPAMFKTMVSARANESNH